MSQSLLGHAVQRSEDPRFLRGAAHYVADLPSDRALHAKFIRSQVAHGVIVGIDLDGARQAPGVVDVVTAENLDLGPLPEFPPPRGGSRAALARPCLAARRLRFVGEPYAVIVAETAAAAEDAAELVALEYEELPVVVDPMVALHSDAPALFPEFGSNLVVDIPPDADDDPLQGADVVVQARFHNQRLAAAPLEPNGVLAEPAPDGHLTLWASCQAPFALRDAAARSLGMEPRCLRIVVPAVGGGFGAKGGIYPEQVVVAALARRLGRPVRWAETRTENLLGMTQGRDQVQELELGARRDGTLVGMRCRTINDLGAYSWRGSFIPGTTRIMASGVYRLPRISIRSSAVVTNKCPVGPYRGAGRPEATAMLERGMDMLAAEMGLDPVDLRRRNLIESSQFPYQTPTGASYDSGDYLASLELALKMVGYEELRAEQEQRRLAGDTSRLLGIGVSCFTEISGAGTEYASVRVAPDGTVFVHSGTSPHGQGHETTLAQVAASVLGVPFASVQIVHSDTAVVARGVGTFGSRSGQLGGSAVFQASEDVVAQAKRLTALLLEAEVEDIVQSPDGAFGVAGVPARSVSWAELARARQEQPGLAPDEPLASSGDFDQPSATYPFGTHIAVVEIDGETGQVTLVRLTAVDDCGQILNPLIVHGQVHGGLAQGVAQALYEEVSYDERGNPLTSTLADYLCPSAADLPSWDLGETITPSPRNPLGMKGVGESGAVGAPPAIQNAVVDALAPYGIRHLDLPLTSQRVWNAIRLAVS